MTPFDVLKAMFWPLIRYTGGLTHAQISLAAFFCVPSTSTRSSRRRMKRPCPSTSGSRTSGSTMRGLMVKRVMGPVARPMRGSGVGVGAGRGVAAGDAPGFGPGSTGELPPPQAAVRPAMDTASSAAGRRTEWSIRDLVELRTAIAARERVDDGMNDLRGDPVASRAQMAEAVQGEILEGKLSRPIVCAHGDEGGPAETARSERGHHRVVAGPRAPVGVNDDDECRARLRGPVRHDQD